MDSLREMPEGARHQGKMSVVASEPEKESVYRRRISRKARAGVIKGTRKREFEWYRG